MPQPPIPHSKNPSIDRLLDAVDWPLALKAIVYAFAGTTFLLLLVACVSEIGFTDNQYNHALVARSALAPAPPLLVSSYLHWYFTDLDIIRPEDWHRSSYLLLLTELRHHLGSAAQYLTTALYLGITLANLLLIGLIAVRASESAGACVGRLSWGAALLLIAPIVTANNWMPLLLAADYLDDLPVALLAFSAAAVLVLRGLGPWNCLAVGLLLGLAVSVKLLYLLLLPAFLLAILLLTWQERKRFRILRTSGRALAYLGGYAVALAPTLYWSERELGLLLPEQARLGLIARLRADSPDGEHDLYFLKPELSPQHSWLNQMLENGLVSEVWDGLLQVLLALQHGWLILLIGLLGLCAAYGVRKERPLSAAFRRLSVLFGFSFAAFFCFLALKLGEAGQLRYWLVPFGLATALGIAGLYAYAAAKGGFTRLLATRRLGTAGLTVACFIIVLNAVGQAMHPVRMLLLDQYDYPAAIKQRLAELSDEEAVMLHTNYGVNHWIDQPMAKIVGIKPLILETLTSGQLEALVRRYDIAAASYRDPRISGKPDPSNPVADLEDKGFCRDLVVGDHVVLVWQGDAGASRC